MKKIFILVVLTPIFFYLFNLDYGHPGPGGPAAIMQGAKVREQKIYGKDYTYRGKVKSTPGGFSIIYDKDHNRVGQVKDGVIYDKQWNRVGEVKYEISPVE